jgi:aspartyl-tRNA(Asn)/glutamyl-tRNA(Gln) amidotransferase subunit A
MDHPGPITGCVRDLALVLQTIAGSDLRDPVCSGRAVPDWVAPLEQELPVPRLGRLRGLFEQLAEPVVLDMLETVLQKLRDGGATITEVALPATFAEVIPRHRLVMAVEAAQFHTPRLTRHADDYPPNIRALLEEGLAASAVEYARCKEHQTQLSQQVLSLFAGVDVLITPATTDAAPAAATTGNPAFNSPWSYTGLPTVSIPTGLSPDRLPLAVQLVGRPWAEADVLAAAAWCEEVLDVGRLQPPS